MYWYGWHQNENLYDSTLKTCLFKPSSEEYTFGSSPPETLRELGYQWLTVTQAKTISKPIHTIDFRSKNYYHCLGSSQQCSCSCNMFLSSNREVLSTENIHFMLYFNLSFNYFIFLWVVYTCYSYYMHGFLLPYTWKIYNTLYTTLTHYWSTVKQPI